MINREYIRKNNRSGKRIFVNLTFASLTFESIRKIENRQDLRFACNAPVRTLFTSFSFNAKRKTFGFSPAAAFLTSFDLEPASTRGGFEVTTKADFAFGFPDLAAATDFAFGFD